MKYFQYKNIPHKSSLCFQTSLFSIRLDYRPRDPVLAGGFTLKSISDQESNNCAGRNNAINNPCDRQIMMEIGFDQIDKQLAEEGDFKDQI